MVRPRVLCLLVVCLLALPAVAQPSTPSAKSADFARRHGGEDLLRRVREFVRGESQTNGMRSLSIGGTVWSNIGPTNAAGETMSIAIDPSSSAGSAPNLIVASAYGGAWKSTDGAANWTPLTDSLPSIAVSAVMIAPSNASIVYAATGRPAIDKASGIGLLASSDGGATWTLPNSVVASQIYTISINPANPLDILLGTNAGGLRSTNGQNGPWTTVINSASSASTIGYGDVTQIIRDATDAQRLFAVTWDRNQWCASRTCTDPANFAAPTVLASADGGATWTPKMNGMPSPKSYQPSRMAIAMAPSSPQTLYISVEYAEPSRWWDYSTYVVKTTSGGDAWTFTPHDPDMPNIDFLGGYARYANAIAVSPADPNHVIAAGTSYAETTDGGNTWTTAFNRPNVHDLRYDANGLLWAAHDSGISTTTSGITSFVDRVNGLATGDFFGIASDPIHRNRVLGGMSSNGFGFRPDAGGTAWTGFSEPWDGIQCVINEENPAIGFATVDSAGIARSVNLGTATPSFDWINPVPLPGSRPWYTPLAADRVNPATLYLGSSSLWKTTTSGDFWLQMPKATTDGSSWNSNPEIDAIAVSRSNPQVVVLTDYAGEVFRSVDGGVTWTKRSLGLPASWINGIEIDPSDANTMYVAMSNTATPVWYTTNGGVSWTSRSNGLPAFVADVVRVDPTDSATLYCGTGGGLYRSIDGGANWSRFGSGLPLAFIEDIQITRDGSIVRVATYGRGVWELAVTGNTNHPPAVAITSPGTAAVVIPRNGALNLSGTFSDPDGDPVTAAWSFPDLWSKTEATSGATIARIFPVSGTFPVTLIATDSHGAKGAATVMVTVPEDADGCGSPVVIPPAGPFPYSVVVNEEIATAEPSDPTGSCTTFPLTKTAWVEFTPAVGGTYTFTIWSTRGFVDVLAYSGSACGPYTPMNVCFHGSPGQTTGFVDVPLAANQTIRLMVRNAGADSPVTISVSSSGRGTSIVNGVFPAGGPAAGGTDVVIRGAFFASGATVTFGGAAATNVTLLDSATILATTPAHAAGAVDVAVSNPGAVPAILGNDFTYVSPQVVTPSSFYTLTPCRLIDTRNPNGPYGGPSLGPVATRNVMAAGFCGVPAGVQSLAVNLTAVTAGANGWLTLFPGPAFNPVPFVSTLNYSTGKTLANFAIVPVAADGTINVYNSGPYAVQFIIDVMGYFQ